MRQKCTLSVKIMQTKHGCVHQASAAGVGKRATPAAVERGTGRNRAAGIGGFRTPAAVQGESGAKV